MRKVAVLFAFAGLFLLVSCDKTSFTEDFQITSKANGGAGGFGNNINPNSPYTRDTVTTNVYVEEHLIRVLLLSLSQDEITYILARQVPTSYIYTYSDLHMPAQYVPVGKDINDPIWREATITFNAGFDPHQFLSYIELEAAIHSGEVTITETNNFYRYNILGKG